MRINVGHCNTAPVCTSPASRQVAVSLSSESWTRKAGLKAMNERIVPLFSLSAKCFHLPCG